MKFAGYARRRWQGYSAHAAGVLSKASGRGDKTVGALTVVVLAWLLADSLDELLAGFLAGMMR